MELSVLSSIYVQFLSLSAILLARGVNAVFYIERKVVLEVELPDGQRWTQIQKADHSLYVCSNYKYRNDDGSEHFVITCKEVTNALSKRRVYGGANFFSVSAPVLGPRTLLLLGEKHVRSDKELPVDLRIGFIPGVAKGAMDFPLFMPYGRPDELNRLVEQVKPLVNVGVTESELVDVAVVFNVVTIPTTPSAQLYKWQIPKFTEALKKFMMVLETVKLRDKENGPLTPENWRKLVKLFLNKMIDPCSVPAPFNAGKADPGIMCRTYCQYFILARSFFGLSNPYCNSLNSQKAACKSGACTCYAKGIYPVKMLYCNNEFRLQLDKLLPMRIKYQEPVPQPT